MRKAQKEPGSFCPLIQKECIGWDCSWYTHIRGMNVNTGEEMDHEGCSMAFLPMLLVDNTQQTRQAGAAIESMRNEVVKGQEVANQIAYTALTQELPALPAPDPVNITPAEYEVIR